MKQKNCEFSHKTVRKIKITGEIPHDMCYNEAMNYQHIPFTREKSAAFDVIIVGGGMAGVCAAIASARHGAKTALIQDRPMLGGNASSEIRMHICGASENQKKPELEEGGILHEILLSNKSRNDSFNFSVWDMTLYEAVKSQKNLTLYLNTAMTDCIMDGDRITSVRCRQLTTETNYTFTANIFVDATGIGTLAHLSGADYAIGSEGKDEFGEPDAPEHGNLDRMGNTLLLKAVDRGHPVTFTPPSFARHFTEEELRYRPHSTGFTVAVGDNADYTRMTAFSTSAVDYGYWWIELCGYTDDFFSEYEDIRDELMSCVWGVWDHIKNGGNHGAENYDLEWVGILPGMREGRRVLGDYILTENDILANRTFDDGVAYGGWAMDVHTPGGLYDFDKRPSSIYCFDGTYEIPYRCYYSRNVSNLMMAGKIISASKMGMSSTRVIGTCAIGGQAVGTAAAMCIEKSVTPRGLLPYVPELRRNLLKDDCYLPGYTGTTGNLLTAVCASSSRDGGEPENVLNGITRAMNGQENCWISDGISPVGETLTLTLDQSARLSEIRLVFDSNFKYPIKITLSDKRRAQQRIGVPPELVRDYTVQLKKNGAITAEQTVLKNCQRLNILRFEGAEADTVEVTVHATNGSYDVRIFEIGAYQ